MFNYRVARTCHNGSRRDLLVDFVAPIYWSLHSLSPMGGEQLAASFTDCYLEVK